MKRRIIEGDKICSGCNKSFHFVCKSYLCGNGYYRIGAEPKTCSNKCRYKSASITGTHHMYRLCVACNKEFHFPPSVAKDRATIYCYMKCRRNDKIPYTEKQKDDARNYAYFHLEKQSCVKCKNVKSEAHHYKGYARENWLTVVWLCKKHHAEEHNYLRRMRLNSSL